MLIGEFLDELSKLYEHTNVLLLKGMQKIRCQK